MERFFEGSYESVKRYVRKLSECEEVPFRRMEVLPGTECQVDYGTGARVVGEDGKRRKTHLFRCTLSFSRKAYSEVSFTQETECFLRALENAFRHFGGVPQIVVIDNLKAGVIKPCVYDPELNPKLREFAMHYGTCILLSRVRTPRHKGKVERQVGYAQDNALKGRTFKSPAEQNTRLRVHSSACRPAHDRPARHRQNPSGSGSVLRSDQTRPHRALYLHLRARARTHG